MKNQERWDFSQKYASIEMIKLAGLLVMSSILGIIFSPNSQTGLFLGLRLMILMIVFLIFRVEKPLKRNLKAIIGAKKNDFFKMKSN